MIALDFMRFACKVIFLNENFFISSLKIKSIENRILFFIQFYNIAIFLKYSTDVISNNEKKGK